MGRYAAQISIWIIGCWLFGTAPLRGQISSQGGEEIVAVASSGDGAALATVNRMGVVRVRDGKSNRVIREMNSHGLEGVSLNGCRRVFFLPENRLAVLGFSELRIFDIEKGERIATYQSEKGFENTVSSNGRYFIYFRRGLTEVIDLFNGSVLARRAVKSHRAMDVSGDGKYLYHYLEDRNVIECMDVATGKIIFWLPADKVQRIILTKGDNVLLGIGYRKALMWDLQAKSRPPLEFRTDTRDPDQPFVNGEKWLVLPGALHKDIVVYDLDKPAAAPLSVALKPLTGAGASTSTNRILLAKVSEVWEYNLATGRQVIAGGGVSDVYRSVCLSTDEKQLFLGTEEGYIKYFDIETGTFRGVYRSTGKPVHFLKFSADGRELEAGDLHSVEVIDLQTGKIRRTYERPQVSPDHTFILDRAKTLTATIISGEISLTRNAMTLKITTRSGNNRDYFVYENSSMLFDASTGGIDALGIFKLGENAISPSQLSAYFYRPDLLPAFFSEGNSLPRLVTEMRNRFRRVGLFPEVSLQPSGRKVKISVKSQGGGIGPVNVYLNDKLIMEDAREGAAGVPGEGMTIMLDPARFPNYDRTGPNQVGVKAFNKEGDASSRKFSLPLPAGQPAAPQGNIQGTGDAENSRPRLWALTVGISGYGSPDLFLNFAARDADDMHRALDIGGRILFDNRVSLYNLTTGSKTDSLQPTARNIRRILRTISANARRDDVVLLYFAGHGQASENNGPFYFLASGAKGFAGSYSPEEAITDDDILRTFVDSRCTKQILVLDACYSGKVIDRMVSRGQRANSIRAFERMYDQSAAYILTSSSSSQKSWESSEFGQGLLTHFLLEGMRGPSLDDGILTALRWMDYAKEELEKYMDKRLKAGSLFSELQTPRIFSGKDIVPVAVAQFPDAASRAKIPLNAPKLLAGPVTLLNKQLIDPLDLQEKVNRALSQSPPDRSPFYYMPDTDYPASYRLVGSYEVDPRTGEIRLEKATVVRDKSEQATVVLSGRFRSGEELIEELVSEFAAFCEKAGQ